jgi:hypothetical protein
MPGKNLTIHSRIYTGFPSLQHLEECFGITNASFLSLSESHVIVYRSTPEVLLTELEVEYVVHYVKHIFAGHIVLQFNVKNTVEHQVLQGVCVNIDTNGSKSYVHCGSVPAEEVRFGTPGLCYVVLARNSQPEHASVPCELAFRVVQIDLATQQPIGDPRGDEEIYPLENLEIAISDFMAKVSPPSDFRRAWEQVCEELSTCYVQSLTCFARKMKRWEMKTRSWRNLPCRSRSWMKL